VAQILQWAMYNEVNEGAKPVMFYCHSSR